MIVLVTGKDGQLGKCMQSSCKVDEKNKYVFFNHKELDIASEESIEKIFKQVNPDFVVNCAAYTDTRMAEENYEDAYNVNARAVDLLAKECRKYNAYFIHISTESVFDGKKRTPYKEDDTRNPLSVYSLTKKIGEDFALEYKKSIVIRVPWLYSEFGKNFYRIMSERIHFNMVTNVVNDQIGTPTYARDLSDFIVSYLVNCKDIENRCGVYHFSNNGCASWYDFASAIESLQRELKDTNEIKYNINNKYILPTTTKKYGDNVQRPKYSILSLNKIADNFNYIPYHWISALVRCMKLDNEI